MTLTIPFPDFVPGEDIESGQIDANFSTIVAYINSLEAQVATKIGSIGGAVTGDLDMSGAYTLLNIRDAVQNNQPATFGQLVARINSYLPVGTVLPYLADAPPNSDYLVLNGTTFSAVSYPLLATLLGTTTLPDLRGRTIVGMGQGIGLTSRSVRSFGGTETCSLSEGELPLHTHTLTDPGHIHSISDPGHIHSISDPGHLHYSIVVQGSSSDNGDPGNYVVTSGGQYNGLMSVGGYTGGAVTGVTLRTGYTGASLSRQTTGITITSTGGGMAHNNMQPFYVVNFIVKAR